MPERKSTVTIALDKYDEAIDAIKKSEARWMEVNEEYALVSDLLLDLVKGIRKEVMVQVNTNVYLPAEIIHTNEVLFLLGDNWFAEISAHRALQLIDCRRNWIRGELSRLDSELVRLRCEVDLLDKFSKKTAETLEIREEYEDDRSLPAEDALESESSITHNVLDPKRGVLRSYNDLDPAEKSLLASLSAHLETEERSAGHSEATSKSSLANDVIGSADAKKNVSFDLSSTAVIGYSEWEEMNSALSKGSRSSRTTKSVVGDVVENEVSDEDEDEADDIMLGKQLCEEYATKRAHLIQSELLSSDKENTDYDNGRGYTCLEKVPIVGCSTKFDHSEGVQQHGEK